MPNATEITEQVKAAYERITAAEQDCPYCALYPEIDAMVKDTDLAEFVDLNAVALATKACPKCHGTKRVPLLNPGLMRVECRSTKDYIGGVGLSYAALQACEYFCASGECQCQGRSYVPTYSLEGLMKALLLLSPQPTVQYNPEFHDPNLDGDDLWMVGLFNNYGKKGEEQKYGRGIDPILAVAALAALTVAGLLEVET